MVELTKTKRIFLYVLTAFIALTLAFIFSNSLRTPEQSMEQSTAAQGFLAQILPPDTDLGGFVHNNVRKIAHFAEYGILGVEIAIFVAFYLHKRIKMALMSLPTAACVALFDETLQHLSGRGPAILDVWIDLGGFALLSLVTYGVIWVVLTVGAKRKNRNDSTEIKNG